MLNNMSVNVLSRRTCILCLRQTSLPDKSKLRRLLSSKSRLTNAEVRKRRNALFDTEKERQASLIKRIEKIEIEYHGIPEKYAMLMNKNLSTPYNCAMHISEFLMKRSVVAKVNGELWDMHRPLTQDCTLEFLHMKDQDTLAQNNIFWRSCSFVLGHILETAFKADIFVELCEFPKPDVRSGCFLYDADLKLPNWNPSSRELQSLSLIGGRLWTTDHQFERLDVPQDVAQQMFEDNQFKSRQIPDIAQSSPDHKVTVYRMGSHIDISRGPLISLSSQIGRFAVEAVHDIEHSEYGTIQRVQGVALPSDIRMNWWEWDLLRKRASKKVPYVPKMKKVERVIEIIEKKQVSDGVKF